jgi:hypothetical protein
MKQFFCDETGQLSMKRICGLLCTISLCVTMYHNSFSDEHTVPSSILVESVALLAFGCLGLTSVEKIFKNKNNKNERSENAGEDSTIAS